MSITRITHPDVGLLGRIFTPDTNDALYPLSQIMSAEPPRTTPWGIGPILDQARVPQCVAFTTRAWLNAEPTLDPDQANPAPQQIYDGAQANDGIPGPHDGSNDRGAMKYMQSIGMVDAYHWAQSVDEAIAYLTTTGPLLCGANWHQGQFSPDGNGFIRPIGPVEGGHEFMAFWYDATESAMWFQNSWGVGWNPAFPGRFKMLRTDVDTLFAEGMDFCAATVHFPRPNP